MAGSKVASGKHMARKAIAVLMAIVLTVSLCPLPGASERAYADLQASSALQSSVETQARDVSVNDMKKSIKTVVESVDKLKEIMKPEEQDVLVSIFSSFASGVSTVAGAIGSATTFLKLIGVMQDATTKSLADITQQLTNISEKLSAMDKKLDQISDQMTKMQANEDFLIRGVKATQFLSEWYSFEHDYMEKGMDELMNQYDAMMLNHIRDWMNGSRQTDASGVRTDLAVVLYNGASSSGASAAPELKPTAMNNIEPNVNKSDIVNPDPYTMYADDEGFDSANGKFLILDDTFLPKQGDIRWNVNTYRDDLKSYFKGKLQTLRDDVRRGASVADHVKDYRMNIATWSDDDIETYANDVTDAILYRINYVMINESADFALNVQKQFGEYCAHVASMQQGVDAMLKTMFLTHAFEFEIADDIDAFCNQMILRTGVYSMFATNVLGMSEYVKDDKKMETAASMCEAIDSIRGLYSNSVTGNGRYCYVTNSILNYADVEFSGSAEVQYYNRGAVNGFESYSASSLKATYSSDVPLPSTPDMVGDENALVIAYLLRNNGIEFNHDFLNERFTSTKRTQKSALLTTLNGEQLMTTDASVLMKSHKVIGGYFSGDPQIRLNNLPKSASEKYLQSRKMMVGSTLNTSTLALKHNQALFGTAVYGENHWYWEVDEVALMGGPVNDPTFKESYSKKRTSAGFFSDTYKAYYSNSVQYNCLLQIPVSPIKNEPGPFTLDDFTDISEEMRVEAQARSELRTAIENAEANKGVGWTEKDIESFHKTIAEAKEVLESSKATITELKREVTRLQEAESYFESIARQAQEMTVSASDKTVKAKKLKTGKIVFDAITVNDAQGAVTFKKVSVVKKKFAKKIAVAKKTGKITLKKGLKKGTYKVKVNVRAAGDSSYMPATQEVTVKVTVK